MTRTKFLELVNSMSFADGKFLENKDSECMYLILKFLNPAVTIIGNEIREICYFYNDNAYHLYVDNYNNFIIKEVTKF